MCKHKPRLGARRLDERTFVVLLQEQGRSSVSGNDIHQPLTLAGRQLLAARSLAHQFQGSFQLGTVDCQPALVDCVSLDEMVSRRRRRPDAKFGALLRFDAIADRNNDVEIAVFDVLSHLSCTFLANYPKIPDSCLFIPFAGWSGANFERRIVVSEQSLVGYLARELP